MSHFLQEWSTDFQRRVSFTPLQLQPLSWFLGYKSQQYLSTDVSALNTTRFKQHGHRRMHLRRRPLPVLRRACNEGMVSHLATPKADVQAICHCLTCRHITGSTYSTNIVIPEGNFRYTAGDPQEYTTKQDSGMLLSYRFCARCGCLLTKTADAEAFKGVVLVVAGSLDDENGIASAEPGAEFYVSRRAPWLPALDGKMQAAEFPSG